MKPRWYQQEAHDSTYDYFRAGNTGNPLIEAPTGSGKSLIIASLAHSVCDGRPTVRVLVLAHQKELIEQNLEKLLAVWPAAPAGLNVASLKQRDFDKQIIFASIHSVANHAQALGFFSLVIIDEAHMIPEKGEGRYNKLLDGLREINPDLRVVGLTATPYRMKSGHLIGEDTLFTDIAYSVDMKRLIEEGYLSKVFSKKTDIQIDVSAVKKRGGEFVAGDLEDAADVYTQSIIPELVTLGEDRKSWIVFCCGVAHADHVTELLNEHGIYSAVITGATDKDEREELISLFRAGVLRCLVNVNVLTTGFDAPNVDLIAMLRPTLSTGLYVQMIGRGMRVAGGKENCIVLDFAGNIFRHGPIDCISKDRVVKSDEACEAPTKVCPECSTVLHASVNTCGFCGYKFPPPELDLDTTASTKELLSFDAKPLVYAVTSISLARHKKPGKPDSLKIEFYDGSIFPVHTAWACLDHGGYAAEKAQALAGKWLGFAPKSVDEALSGPKQLEVSGQLSLKKNGKYFEIAASEVEQTAIELLKAS